MNNKIRKNNRHYVSDQHGLARTRDLTRILSILKDSKKLMSAKDFIDSGVASNYLGDALNWLYSNGIIDLTITNGSRNGMKSYFITKDNHISKNIIPKQMSAIDKFFDKHRIIVGNGKYYRIEKKDYQKFFSELNKGGNK